MFFMLSVKQSSGGIKERLHDLVHPPEVLSEKISIPGILPFYKITAKTYRGIIPWNTIEAVSGKLRHRAVLPVGTEMPEDCGIECFVPKVLPERILFNSAVKTLEKMALDPTKVIVTVFDENAYLVDLVEKLVQFACRIQVVTSCTADYERLGERLLEKYGLSLIISGRADSSILTSTVIISAKTSCVPLIYRGILFTNERRKMMNATVLTGDRLTLPESLSSFVPDDINKLTFAGAVYELCSADELGGLSFDNMIIVA